MGDSIRYFRDSSSNVVGGCSVLGMGEYIHQSSFHDDDGVRRLVASLSLSVRHQQFMLLESFVDDRNALPAFSRASNLSHISPLLDAQVTWLQDHAWFLSRKEQEQMLSAMYAHYSSTALLLNACCLLLSLMKTAASQQPSFVRLMWQ